MNEVLSFNSETAVANFFGEGSQEATLATDFFSGYADSLGNMLFARLPVGAAERACLGEILARSPSHNCNRSAGRFRSLLKATSSLLRSQASQPSQARRRPYKPAQRQLPVGAVTTGSSIAPASASFKGSIYTWVVDTAQSVASEAMTMTAAPLMVTYNPITGATENSASFWIEENGNFLSLASTKTYASGAAAASLGLTQSSGAYLSTPGELVISPSAWMDNIIDNENSQWSSFQTTFLLDSSTADDLSAWAQSTGGQFQCLENETSSTPPVVRQLHVIQDRRRPLERA
ncbi:MAG: hypothetical protein ACLQVF_16460 [Isosphaeraceae bacterium]